MAKSTSGSGWRQKSTGFLGGLAAVALIVALVGGMAIGYAVEKSRVKTTPKASVNNTTKNKKKAAAKPVRLSGTVDTVAGKVITITPKTGAKVKVTLTAKTTIVKAVSGASGDIASEVRVLFVGSGSFTTAKAVIVLPKGAKLGDLVSAVDAGSMTIKAAAKKGAASKITTTGASVSKISPATAADVTKGTKIIVAAARNLKGVAFATEIIVLPNDSPFA